MAKKAQDEFEVDNIKLSNRFAQLSVANDEKEVESSKVESEVVSF